MNDHYVYLLMDSSDTPFYVGISENVELRVYNHSLRFGKEIKYKILDKFSDRKEGCEAEKRWIRYYIDQGFNLENRVIYDYDETVSVRIDSAILRKIKIFVAENGGSIRKVLESGALWVMSKGAKECIQKLKK